MGRFEAGEVESFGGWIESRRRALNLTRLELAEKVGCAAVTIKKIERDERKPSSQMAVLLADHLAVPRMDRELFMRMARGIYADRASARQMALRIPPYLQQETPTNPASLTPDFVERRKELSRLQTGLNQALAASATPLFVLGDAGSGKTSLMREFARLMQEAHPALLVAVGQCNAQTGQGDAFRPFRDILGMLTGDLEIELMAGRLSREQAVQLWTSVPDVLDAIAVFGPHLLNSLLPLSPLMRRVTPYLGADTTWFDRFQKTVDTESSRYAGLQQSQILEEMTQVFRALAGQHPLLLVLDDLQWADDSSLNLLFHLSRRLTGSRIMIVGAYRTGSPVLAQPAGQLVEGEIHTTENLILELTRQYGDVQIRLDQMSATDGRAFIDAILDQEPNRLGESFRGDLFVRTRGHPLFTTETLQGMRQNQEIVRDGDGYWVENKSSPSHPRPARVEAVIAQRLAHLDAMERQILDVASVEGEAFSAELLANVLHIDLGMTLKALAHDLGQMNRLVQEQGQLSVGSLRFNRFQFHHMLVQEHVYGELEAAEKHRLHHRIAEELERILLEPQSGRDSIGTALAARDTVVRPEYLDAFGPALLHHFASSEDWAKAAIYAFHLGERASQQYAMREAIAYHEQALLALGRLSDARQDFVFDVLLGWEEAAFNFTPYEEQLARLSRAEDIARKLNDKPRLIRALHWTANVLLARGLWTQAAPALTESLSLAEELGNEELSVRPMFFKAFMTSFANLPEALKWIGRAEDLSHKYGDLRIEATALGTEGQVRALLGEFAGAEQAIEHARQVSSRLGSPLVDSDVDLFGALTALAMGKPEQALELGQRSVERSVATDNMDCICSGMVCIGYINLELGRISEAASAFKAGIERSVLAGAIITNQNGQAGLAMTRFMDGHPDAIEELQSIILEMNSLENRAGAANASQLLGTCLTQIGDLERASARLSEAVDFYRESRMRPSLARALAGLAELREAQGQVAEARDLRTEVQALRL